MGRFEVQGIVSRATGEPMVQFRQLDADGEIQFGFQVSPDEARDIAHNTLEASMNAVYDAAIIAWAKEGENPEIGIMLVDTIRKYRADRWGLPDEPKDWRPNERDT
jgi:hypothetical protein